MTSEHTFHPFDTDMGRLRGGVLRIAAIVERLLVRAVKAALMQDQERAARVIADEAVVHELHAEIDGQAALTIARQQPAAGDLQEIVAVFHLIDDLERIGQESRRIARRVQQGEQFEKLPEPAELEAIATETADLLRRAVDAFVHHDSPAAASVREASESLEQRAQDLLSRIQTAMQEEGARVQPLLAMNFVVQSVSRSVSHTQHIAEYLERAFAGRPRR
ncbi:MAG: phosphate uptake regulator, PhoU [Pseudomonadota bacterium]|jgi:phosphate transport system protein